MAKHGKKYTAALAKVEADKEYSVREAVSLAKETSTTKFDSTVEVHLRTALDPRQADQQVRDVVVLPHGLGKTVKVLVFAQGEGATAAREAGADMVADDDLPDFPRAIVDGYAVKGASTFGSSESNPAYLTLSGSIAMGESPEIAVGPGEAAQIATGGMLPPGADSVVMIEHTEAIDDTTIEVYRSVAPGQNMIAIGEDIKKQTRVLLNGQMIQLFVFNHIILNKLILKPIKNGLNQK